MPPLPLPQSWSSPSSQPSHTTMAHCNGTQQWRHVHSTKVGRHPPPNHSTLQCHLTKAPSNGTTSTAPCNGTLQWHHVHSTIAHYTGTLQRHPAMHHVHSTIVHYNGTLQWHHVHSTMTHYNGTLQRQWHHVHSTIAHHNGTLQRHPAMAPRPLNQSTLQWHPAMAPSNGTTSTAPCNGILVPRPMRKSGSSPSPPIGSKNPYSYRYLGKNKRQLRCGSGASYRYLHIFRQSTVTAYQLSLSRKSFCKKSFHLPNAFFVSKQGDHDHDHVSST